MLFSKSKRAGYLLEGGRLPLYSHAYITNFPKSKKGRVPLVVGGVAGPGTFSSDGGGGGPKGRVPLGRGGGATLV